MHRPSANKQDAVLSTPTRSSIKVYEQESPNKGNAVFGTPLEIIPNKLYWISDSKPPQNYSSAFFFNIDNVSESILEYKK